MEVLDSGVLSQFLGAWGDDFGGGPRVKACEGAFAEKLGAAHAISVNSATTALETAVAATGIAPGDEVVVSPYTMTASAACVVAQGAIPVFADIEDRTYGLDPDSVAARITERTTGIVVPHIFGHPARMEGLLELAERHGLVLIEDAAQSIGSTWRGRQTGTIGAAGVLSLNYHKIIHSGEGGMILTADDRVAEKARLVRNHGETVVEDAGVDDIVNTLGSNYRMTEIEAAIAAEQLKKLDGLLETRRRLAAYLTERLSEVPGLVTPVVEPDCTHSWYLYVVRLDEAALERAARPAIARALQAEGIPIVEGYVKPLYLQPMYQRRIARGPDGAPWTDARWQGQVSYEKGICPVVERCHEREVLFTDVCRTPLTEADMDDVVEAFVKVMGALDTLPAAS